MLASTCLYSLYALLSYCISSCRCQKYHAQFIQRNEAIVTRYSACYFNPVLFLQSGWMLLS